MTVIDDNYREQFEDMVIAKERNKTKNKKEKNMGGGNLITSRNSETTSVKNSEYSAHYDKSFDGKKVDVYRILKIFDITEPAQQHAIKKLLRAGNSTKSLERDIDEVIISLERWKEMIEEDNG